MSIYDLPKEMLIKMIIYSQEESQAKIKNLQKKLNRMNVILRSVEFAGQGPFKILECPLCDNVLFFIGHQQRYIIRAEFVDEQNPICDTKYDWCRSCELSYSVFYCEKHKKNGEWCSVNNECRNCHIDYGVCDVKCPYKFDEYYTCSSWHCRKLIKKNDTQKYCVYEYGDGEVEYKCIDCHYGKKCWFENCLLFDSSMSNA